MQELYHLQKPPCTNHSQDATIIPMLSKDLVWRITVQVKRLTLKGTAQINNFNMKHKLNLYYRSTPLLATNSIQTLFYNYKFYLKHWRAKTEHNPLFSGICRIIQHLILKFCSYQTKKLYDYSITSFSQLFAIQSAANCHILVWCPLIGALSPGTYSVGPFLSTQLINATIYKQCICL